MVARRWSTAFIVIVAGLLLTTSGALSGATIDPASDQPSAHPAQSDPPTAPQLRNQQSATTEAPPVAITGTADGTRAIVVNRSGELSLFLSDAAGDRVGEHLAFATCASGCWLNIAVDGNVGGSAGVVTWTDGDTVNAGTFTVGPDPTVTTLVVAATAGLQIAGLQNAALHSADLQSAQTSTIAPAGTPNVAIGPDGSFVVVWNSGGTIAGEHIRDGLPVAGGVSIPPPADTVTSDPDVGVGADGNFLLVWNSAPVGGGPGSVNGAAFDGNCALLNEFEIDPGPGGNLFGNPFVGLNDVDGFAIGFGQSDGTGSTIDLVPGVFPPGVGATPGMVDTIVQRTADPQGDPGAPADLPIEIVSLSLTSVDPIVVTFDGVEQQWAVELNLDTLQDAQAQGTMTITPFDPASPDVPLDPIFDFATPINPPSVPGLTPAPGTNPFLGVGTGPDGNVNQLWGDWFFIDPSVPFAGGNPVHIGANGTPGTGFGDPFAGPGFGGCCADAGDPHSTTTLSGVTNPGVTLNGLPLPNQTAVQCDAGSCTLGQSSAFDALGGTFGLSHDSLLGGGANPSQSDATTGSRSGELVTIVDGVDVDGDGSWDIGVFVTPGGETVYVELTGGQYVVTEIVRVAIFSPRLLLVPLIGGALPPGRLDDPTMFTERPLDGPFVNATSLDVWPGTNPGDPPLIGLGTSLPSPDQLWSGMVRVEQRPLDDFVDNFGAPPAAPPVDFLFPGTPDTGFLGDNSLIFVDGFETGDNTVFNPLPRANAAGALLRTAQTDPAAFDCSGLCFAVVLMDLGGGDSDVWLVDVSQAGEDPQIDVLESLPWAARVSGIPHGSQDMSVRLMDFTGDGVLDLAIGVPSDDSAGRRLTTDDAGAIYLIPGPLSGGRLQDLAARRIVGSPGDRLGGGFDFVDLDGDGVLDLIGGAGGLDRIASKDVGGVHVYLGALPTINRVETVNGFTTISGSNLDSLVFIDGLRAAPLSATSTQVVVAGSGEEIVVRGAFGSATGANSRLVSLSQGWNLVGWSGATAVDAALEGFSGTLNTLFIWDATAQTFLSFNPSLPAVLNTLSDLEFGSGVWINVASTGATWDQPTFSGARTVQLRAGFNLVMWTGPDGTPVADAVEGLGDALRSLSTYDAATQRFRSFLPALPAALNTAQTLDFDDGVWINVTRDATWDQPSS